MPSSRKKVVIGLTNPKSTENVGAVLRAAGCFNADEVLYTGQRYTQAAKFNTDTKKAINHIPLQAVNSFLEAKDADMKVICVDLIEGAIPLPDFTHPEKALYIFGPEDGSIAQSIINQADAAVYVPTIGCLNLAATVNVILYDRLAKSEQEIDHDNLIKTSRDNNNNTIVNK